MSSITSPPSKIALASSTKISLNDRFTKLAKNKPLIENQNANFLSNESKIGLASIKNRRLAFQMANRPSVQAALKIKKRSIRQKNIRPIKQRILFNNKNNSFVNFNKPRNLGIDPSRLSGGNNLTKSRGNLAQRLSFNNKTEMKLRKVKKNNLLNGVKKLTKGVKRTGLNRTGLQRKRLQTVGIRSGKRRNNQMLNKNFMPKTKNKLDKDLDQYMAKSKSHLDMDLDQYMAKSKTHLDADLDSYMAQVNSN